MSYIIFVNPAILSQTGMPWGPVFLATIFAPVVRTLVMALFADATAPALIVVGILMLSSFAEIDWDNIDEAIPAFFAGIFMALIYSISYGIAAGFLFYIIVKACKKEMKDVHPILIGSTVLFIINWIILARIM